MQANNIICISIAKTGVVIDPNHEYKHDFGVSIPKFFIILDWSYCARAF